MDGLEALSDSGCDLAPGDIVGGRYEILRLTCRREMSCAYLVKDRALLGEQFLLRAVRRSARGADGEPFDEAVEREMQVKSKLVHPLIQRMHDTGKTDTHHYAVLERLDGERLDKKVRREGPQKQGDVLGWALELCDVLGYLHGQDPPIVFGDVRPGSIFLCSDGHIRLLLDDCSRAYCRSIAGDAGALFAFGYPPPECCGKALPDPRMDVYALGATIWHLLSGEAPKEFPVPDVRVSNPAVDDWLAGTVLHTCLQPDPDRRYQSCKELAVALKGPRRKGARALWGRWRRKTPQR